MNILRQCAIILLCLLAGELLVSVCGIPMPSSLLGMLLLTLLLKLGWIKLAWVSDVSNFLLNHLGLFFVPPAVALMLHFELIRAAWLPIVVSVLLSTLIVLILTGWTFQILRRWK